MIKSDEKRNQWPVGRVIEANVDEQGDCRKVKVRTINGELERPITNVVQLEEYESPPRNRQD